MINFVGLNFIIEKWLENSRCNAILNIAQYDDEGWILRARPLLAGPTLPPCDEIYTMMAIVVIINIEE